jgi:L-ascorbate metabolism protein UlaG (beta-lactamase superfamily)
LKNKLKMFIGLIVLSVILLAVYLYLALRLPLGADPDGDRMNNIKSEQNHRGGRFVNLLETNMMEPGTMWATLRLWFGNEQRVPPSPLPVIFLNAKTFSQQPASGLRVTWLGHATFLVELEGQVIITDPVLGERAFPLSWIGPKRFHPLPILPADLPQIDAVILSHDHYDHLDYESIRILLPKTKRFYVPLGVGAHLEKWGVPSDRIVEMNWWEESALPGQVRLVATPARHYSGRFLKRNNTLWCSWAFVGSKYRIYFGGDTGMSADQFRAIGEKLGPFDYTLIKIGAYGPTWPDIHITPEEAIQVHTFVKGKVFVPTHWGTFNLAFHAWNEPIERLFTAAQKSNVNIVVPKPGQSFGPETQQLAEPWWRTQ